MDWIRLPGSDCPVALYVAVATLAVMLTAVSKGGFGGGVGMLSVPLMLQVAPSARDVLGAWLPVLLVCDFFTLRQYPKEWNRRSMGILAPGAVAGILLGWCVIRVTEKHQSALKLIIGGICFLFVALWLVRSWFERSVKDRPPWRPTWAAALPVGLVAGLTTVLAHAAGVVTTMYLLPQKMDRRAFVGTSARFYLLLNMVKLPLFLVGMMISWGALKGSMWMWALCPVGVWLGGWLNRRLPERSFIKLLYLFLFLGGAKLVYDGMAR